MIIWVILPLAILSAVILVLTKRALKHTPEAYARKLFEGNRMQDAGSPYYRQQD